VLELELVLGQVVLGVGDVGPELQLLQQLVRGVEGGGQLVVPQRGAPLVLGKSNWFIQIILIYFQKERRNVVFIERTQKRTCEESGLCPAWFFKRIFHDMHFGDLL
jgi:hypothetical protein